MGSGYWPLVTFLLGIGLLWYGKLQEKKWPYIIGIVLVGLHVVVAVWSFVEGFIDGVKSSRYKGYM